MAKTSKIVKNEERKVLAARHAEKRAALKKTISSTTATPEEKEAAGKALRKLPRNSTKIRIRNRCVLTGRPRAYYRKFGLSRIAIREKGLAGEIPGLTKSSW